MEKEFYKNLISRLPIGLAMAVVIILLIFLQNKDLINIILYLLSYSLGFEWIYKASKNKILLNILLLSILVSIHFIDADVLKILIIISTIFWLICPILLLPSIRTFTSSFHLPFVFLALVGFLSSGVYMMEYFEYDLINNFFFMFILILITALIDVGAYFFGNFFGKTKLVPKISPNKSLEGLIGGILLASISLTIMLYLDLINPSIALVMVIAMPFAFVGDIFESFLKRSKSMKDTGSLLRGHGGIFDRLDSHLAVFPIATILLIYLII